MQPDGRPSGVVTFLITDQVDSTRTAARLGDDAADELRQTHFALLRTAVDKRGEEVKNLGDGLMFAFAAPGDALRAAVAIQEVVAAHTATHPSLPLAVRIGLYTGEAACQDGDYFGTPVVIASRLCAAAAGGQILAGEVLVTLAGSRGGFRFGPVQRLTLKGLNRPVPAVEVRWGAAPDPVAAPARPRRRESRRGPRGPALVGRDQELALLLDEFAEVAAGELRCVLLVGEPGVGKTRLAGELTARKASDACVLRARANPMSRTISFGLWAEALDPELAELGDDEVADLCGGFLDDLAGLFHRVAAVQGTRAAGEAPTPRLFAGLTRIVDELSSRRPMIVLLDDVHWADASSWEVVRHIARRLDTAPLLLMLTARPGELAANEVASQVLFELEQDDLLSRVELGPLTNAGLQALAEQIAGAAPAPLVDWLVERSAGNALFAIGLLRALVEEGADLSAPVLRRLPESLSERVVARLRAGDPATVAVYEVLAVVGRAASLGELVEMTERPLGEIESSLATLVASRGIREQERGPSLTYETTHPLVRDIAYAEIGGARRRRLHRRVGEVLRRAGRIAEAAVHYARAAEPGDAEAVTVLLEALREAESRGAFREAIGLLAELLDLLADGDDRWLDVLAAIDWRADWLADHRIEANALVAVGALRAMEQQLERTCEDVRRGEVNFRLGYILSWASTEFDEAERAYGIARDLFAGADATHQRLMVERELAWLTGVRGDFAGMLLQSEEVLAAAVSAEDDYAAMQALASVAAANLAAGRFDAALAAIERCRALALDSRAYRPTALLGAAAVLYALGGEPATGLALTAQARRNNPDYRDSLVLDHEVIAHFHAGTYRRGTETCRESESWAPTPQLRRLPGVVFGAQCALELGELSEAERLVARGDAALQDRDWMCYLPLLRWTRGTLLLARGQVAESIRLIEASACRLLEMTAWGFVPPILLDLAEVAEDREVLERAVASAAEVVDRIDRQVPRGVASAVAGWAALARGDGVTAVTHARQAVQLLDAGECAGFAARAHVLLGQALLGTDRREGIAQLEEAARRFGTLEAGRRRDRVLDLLRRQGSAGRRATAAALGPGSLTQREMDVARLAAQGLSAREIGESLFIGERTVETHLGRLYAKLGVDSKLDLVRRAAELGLS